MISVEEILTFVHIVKLGLGPKPNGTTPTPIGNWIGNTHTPKGRGKRPSRNPSGRPIIIMGYSIGAIARGIGKSAGFLARCHKQGRRPSIRTLEAIRVFLQLGTLDEAAQLFAPQVAQAVEDAAKEKKAV